MAVPKYDDLFQPLLDALHQLGGSGTVEEINEKVAEMLNLSEDDVNEIHKGTATKLAYRSGWSKNYLKRYGLIENSERGVWRLTLKGQQTKVVDKADVRRFVQKLSRKQVNVADAANDGLEPNETETTWEEALIQKLLEISPESFEKLCQRILRESGFIQVEVTGKSGDGGIDGKGILRLNGLLSFHIIFQCKRYSGAVSSKEIRDFRGAMQGRADKGLFLTTGTFTRDAKQEATRDGAPPIDLVDGNLLAQKLKELRLGVDVEVQEEVTINPAFFEQYS
ncbi:MAG: restriction endonuclease [Candidatus Dojkabacteria bacterium]|nr:MAG: restriction endonuclease [Candidatus Dojkabacteria bacterium]